MPPQLAGRAGTGASWRNPWQETTVVPGGRSSKASRPVIVAVPVRVTPARTADVTSKGEPACTASGIRTGSSRLAATPQQYPEVSQIEGLASAYAVASKPASSKREAMICPDGGTVPQNVIDPVTRSPAVSAIGVPVGRPTIVYRSVAST